MLDLLMILTLIISFGLLVALVMWCEHEVNKDA